MEVTVDITREDHGHLDNHTKRAVMRITAEGSGILGERRIRIAGDGIHEHPEVETGFQPRGEVSGVVENRDDSFPFVGDKQAHMVPKRAFAGSEAAAEFSGKSAELWRLPTGGSPEA